MPVVCIIANTAATLEAKRELVAKIGAIISEEVHTPTQHVHVYIQDSSFFSFGGDCTTPAAYVTVRAAALQIPPECRKSVVTRMMEHLLAAFPGLQAARTTTMFEELPVENIAVGTSVMVFGSPRGVLVADPSKWPAP